MKALFSRLTNRSKEPTPPSPSSYQHEKPPSLGPLPSWPPRPSDRPQSDVLKPLPDIQSPDEHSSSSSSSPPMPSRPHLSDVIEEPPTPSSSAAPAPASAPAPTPAISRSASRATSPKPGPVGGDSAGRNSSRKQPSKESTSAKDAPDVHKRVAFISPPPTPSTVHAMRSLPDTTPDPSQASSSSALKSTTTTNNRPSQSKDPRGSLSTAASGSRTDVNSSRGTTKATSTRTTAASPHPTKASGGYPTVAEAASASFYQQSLRSGTPYSQRSQATSVVPPASWSEGAEGDLVSNLGARERTRQEVLWEIVASEERYVAELVKMRDTFTIPLLHPYATSPVASPTLAADYDDPPPAASVRFDSPTTESLEHLPIASRFLSPVSFRSDTPTTFTSARRERDRDRDRDPPPAMDNESNVSDDEETDQIGRSYSDSRKNPSAASKHKHPRSPYGSSIRGGKNPTVPFPSRSHHSLPPPPRANPNASTTSLGRQSFVGPSSQEKEKERERERAATGGGGRGAPTPTPSGRGLLRKSKKSLTSSGIIQNGGVAPHQLPDDLRQCLEAIEGSILEGHLKLSDGLRKRYEEQYPLVRSLADVFVANSHILRGYADYVLHLERALDQVQETLTTTMPAKPSKKQDADDYLKVCAFLRRLEVDAQEKGETGLAISLSKPFQRLLKYPLLFQNLLFHTDPSTFEYESTLQMVAEVEAIVRSIEDDKIQKEERDKTRDVLARIDGLERDRQLAAPKPSRVLLDERLIEPAARADSSGASVGGGNGSKASPPSATAAAAGRGVRGKTSFKRLSDVLQSGSKKDIWLVVFNDVTLRCQRTGTTSLPLGSAHANSGSGGRANSMPEHGGKAASGGGSGGKYASAGRRNSHLRPRNLYKFVRVESWNIGDVARPREGVVSMDDVTRSHKETVRLSSQPRIVPMPEDDEDDDRAAIDSDDSDRQSKMSFSYWGADKVTLQKPLVKPRVPGGPNSLGIGGVRGTGARPGQASATGYSRESSANAKFGSRLVADPSMNAPRPASRKTGVRSRAAAAAAAVPAPSAVAAVPSSTMTDDSVRATVTRPEWNGSTRATSTPTPGAKRQRNVSGNAGAGPGPGAKGKAAGVGVASPAPSEDSGVGLYRQIMAKDSMLNAAS